MTKMAITACDIVPTNVAVFDELIAPLATSHSYVRVTKQLMGLAGVRDAAEKLWPDMNIEETKFNQSDWVTFPRPLMITTGYALSWYPEFRVVVYVKDW